jgi:hypothetical protein
MLAAGTFTGFVESFARAGGIVNFAIFSKRAGGVIVAAAGLWFIWNAF